MSGVPLIPVLAAAGIWPEDNGNTGPLGPLSVLHIALSVLNLRGIMLACEKNISSPAGHAELMKVSAHLLVWVWYTTEVKPSREANLGGFQKRKQLS